MGRPGTARAARARRPPRKRAASVGGRSSARGRAPAYHHGDLRNALLAATEGLLGETGVEGFTLREVARRAGVSHGAPAHHFGDVRGLLSAFTADSFSQLAGAMAARRSAAGADPFEQLVATGVAYVDYALSHRARFQLMFRSDRLDPQHGPLIEAGGRAYAHLADCIGLLEARGRGVPDKVKIALAWSIVHGFATLMLDNRGFALEVGSAHALALLEAALRRSRPAFVD